MSQTAVDTLVGVREEIGVKHIFGLIGDSLNPLADSVRRSGIEWVGVRHEEGAALAAAGQAKLTGRLAVRAGTTGPGSTHLVAGLHQAARDHAAVVARRWHQIADERVSNRGAPRVSFLLFGLQSREWGWIPGPFTGSVAETKPRLIVIAAPSRVADPSMSETAVTTSIAYTSGPNKVMLGRTKSRTRSLCSCVEAFSIITCIQWINPQS